MTILDKLYALAEQEEIEVISWDLPVSRCLAIQQEGGSCAIGIDPMYIDSYEEEAELLAHELGHCMTDSFYNAACPLDIRRKHEYHADYWMVSQLAPAEKLSALMAQGQTEPWQMAESLGVSQSVIEKALCIYTHKSML